jgi:hypothetical protein
MTAIRLAGVSIACALAIVGTPAVAAGQATCPAAANLVAFWPLAGATTDVGGGHNGTLVGGATFGPGIVGQALSLDGSSGYLRVPDSPALNPTSAITVAAWINPTAAHGNYPPIVKKNGPSDSAGKGVGLLPHTRRATRLVNVSFRSPIAGRGANGTNLPPAAIDFGASLQMETTSNIDVHRSPRLIVGVAINPARNRIYGGVGADRPMAAIDGMTDAIIITLPPRLIPGRSVASQFGQSGSRALAGERRSA